MKIGGQKNDSAWFRANQWLKKMRANHPTVIGALSADIGLNNAYTHLIHVMDEVEERSGLELSPFLPEGGATPAASLLLQHMNSGIPRTVWMGKLAWDVYDRVVDGSAYPNQYHVDTSAVGEPDITAVGVLRINNTGKDVYASANAERMAAIGQIVRDRVTTARLAFRMANDFANLQHANAGNPGGIADAEKDNEP